MDRRAFLAGGVVLSAMTAARIARAADRKLAVTHYGSLAYGIPVGAAWRAGYFDATGARLDGLLTADGGGTAVRNTLASDLPVGESGLYAIMAARRSGLDLVVIYQAINTAADVSWVVRADSPIKTLQDLAGKTITFTQPKSGSETQIREILARTGLIDKVQLQASGGIREGLSMVEAGAAAAAPIVEPLRTALSSRFRSVVNADDYISRSAQIVGFTTRAFADAERRHAQSTGRGPGARGRSDLQGACNGRETCRTRLSNGARSPGEIDQGAFPAPVLGQGRSQPR